MNKSSIINHEYSTHNLAMNTIKKHSFSIIVPCLNEDKYLEDCLNSILAQSYENNLIEIIIVDGNSNDNTISILKHFVNKYDNITVLNNPDKLTAKSINMGIKASSNELILILSAHAKLDKNFIRINNKLHTSSKAIAIGGLQINIGNNFLQKTIAAAMSSRFGMGSSDYRWRKKQSYVDTVVYGSYKRKVFDEIGLFDDNHSISEDAEFNWRIRQKGYRILFSPEIISYYSVRENIYKFFRQMYNYGQLRVNVLKKHKDSIKYLHLLPPLFSLSFLTTIILSTLSPVFFLAFVGIVSLHLLGGLLIHGFKPISKLKYFPTIQIVFLIMHLCWGVGFIKGWFKK